MARGDSSTHGDDADDEFPLLHGNGLYASAITGDGNCLFHALSDQLYGHENNHSEIRARVISHMRTHSSYFKLFLDVGTTSSGRPKRSKTGSNSSSSVPHSEAAIDQAFENHLKRMAQNGVYGDNMEICAFAREYDCDVKIYQREFAYVVQGGLGGEAGDRKNSKLAHIAYHTWEHYSSIRNIGGPHTGMPNVTPVPISPEAKAEAERRAKSTKGYALPWMVKNVMRSLPYPEKEEDVIKCLEECKGDVNEAVGRLLDKVYQTPAEAGEEGEKSSEAVEGQESKASQITDGASGPSTPAALDGQPPPKSAHAKKGGKRASAKDKAKEVDASTSATASISEPSKTGPGGKQVGKPKRETARERKERQKAAATARKKNPSSSGNSQNAPAAGNKEESNLNTGIKELYI